MNGVRGEQRTLLDVLEHRARSTPDRAAFIFLHDDGRQARLTFRELDRRARRVSVSLNGAAEPGDRVLLLYPPGLEFVSAFFGCLYASTVAVPAHGPTPGQLNGAVRRLGLIAVDAGASVALSTSRLLAMCSDGERGPKLTPAMRWVATDDLPVDEERLLIDGQVTPDRLAMIQYTSGSTKAPKGVMLSHANLMSNQRMLQHALEHTHLSTHVSWLPVQHDMGLIANILQSVYIGATCVLMSPMSFLKSPVRWLRAISDFKARTSGAPNFAYDMCLRKITAEQKFGLDLSSWDVALNAAETVRSETVARFSRAFSEYGFRPRAFYPCYGLAEATVFVSGGAKASLPIIRPTRTSDIAPNLVLAAEPGEVGARELVACGSAAPGEVIVVADPVASTRCGEREIGEVWVSGPNVANGYWNNPEATATTFSAQLADDSQRRFLRTGDLGFFDDGQLFITGRLKDLLIIRGANHHAEDLEVTATRSHPALADGRCAAFSVDIDDEERAVIVHEVAATLSDAGVDDVLQSVVHAIAAEHDIGLHAVVLVKPRSVPKTTSGKTQRKECRANYLDGSLKTIAVKTFDREKRAPQPSGVIRSILEAVTEPEAQRQVLQAFFAELVAASLGVATADVPLDQSLYSLGLDSLAATELRHSVEEALGIVVDFVADGRNSVGALSSAAQRQWRDGYDKGDEGDEKVVRAAARTDPGTDHPVSHGQSALFFLQQLVPESSAYLISRAVRICGPVDVANLQAALQDLVDHHSVLRASFVLTDDGPRQREGSDGQVDFELHDVLGWTEATLAERLHAEAVRPFDLEHDRLMRVRLYRYSPDDHVLLLAFHHIVVDFWSFAVLLRDLGSAYDARSGGAQPIWPDRARGFTEHIHDELAALEGPTGQQLAEYWQRRLTPPPERLELRRGSGVRSTSSGVPERAGFTLDRELAARLRWLGQTQGATLQMVCMAAFQMQLHAYTRRRDFVVGCPMAGRDRVDDAQVVGFFVNVLPIRSQVQGETPFTSLLDQVRDNVSSGLKHQTYPLSLMAAASQSVRRSDHAKLIEAVLLWYGPLAFVGDEFTYLAEGTAATPIDLGRLNVESVPLPQTDPQFDVILVMADSRHDEVRATIEFDASAVDPVIVAKMAADLEGLFRRIVERPDASVATLIGDSGVIPAGDAEVNGAARSLPATLHQQRLMFVDQFETGHVYEHRPTYYNVPLALWIDGPVVASELELALNAASSKHAALRTTVVSDSDGGEVRQIIQATNHVALRVVELDEPAGLQPDVVRALIARKACEPFEPGAESLVRAVLFHTTSDESLLVVTCHHLIVDERSMAILAQDLVAAYESPSALQPSATSHASDDLPHAPDTESALEEPGTSPQLDYWVEQLGDGGTPLTLPSSRARPAIQTFEPGICTFDIAAQTADALDRLMSERGVSLLAVAATALSALLHRYCGEDHIPLGTTTDRRSNGIGVGLVGALDDLLPLRADVGGNPTLGDLLDDLEQTVRLAERNAVVPFDGIVREVVTDRDMSRTPLFDILLSVDTAPDAPYELGGSTARRVHTGLGFGKFDLHVSIRATASALEGVIVYNEDLLEQRMVEGIGGHLDRVFESLVVEPDCRVGELPLVSRLTEPDRPGREPARTLAEMFGRQAALTPDHIALTCGAVEMDYRELDSRSNQLARHLQGEGVGPDELVAVHLEPSLELMVAILAVLKAAGGYLPIDSGLPRERLKFMLEDARPSHVISTADRRPELPDIDVAVTLLDDDYEHIADRSEGPVDAPISAQNLAYCIYTSGSTGVPKGVLVEHQNVARLMETGRSLFGFADTDVWTLFHSFSFDFSVWEMWGALLNGGRLVIVPYLDTRSPGAFLDLLEREGVTVLNQTPSALGALVRAAKESDTSTMPSSMRLLVLGGEPLHRRLLDDWYETFGDRCPDVVNMYGITETTVHVTHFPLAMDDLASGTPIGAPLPGVQVQLLDRYGQEVPDWIPGEICVGGDGVSRGYLNRAALTADRFVPDPSGPRPGHRLYRSGDMARRLPDGSFEFLRRIDHQVKIRGFRVELGEIEARLRQYPEVHDAVVIPDETESSSLALHAYVVADEMTTNMADVRRFVSDMLPAHMIPATLTPIERLPTTPTGKLDRAALPAPVRDRCAVGRHHVEPRTTTERAVIEIWGSVLDVATVSVEDDFFELGGHSLLATQVVSRLRERLGVEVPLRSLFEAPTAVGFARALDLMIDQVAGTREALVPIGRSDSATLSFSQQRLWYLEQLQSGTPVSIVPGALHLRGPVDVGVVEGALTEIVRRHEVLRTTFSTLNGIPTQHVRPVPRITVPVIDLRHLDDHDREAEATDHALRASQRPFDLASDLMLRPLMLRLADDDQLLLLTMHHIASDGWSVGVLMTEFAALYEAGSRGEPADLPELAIQYRDYATWQRETLHGDRVDRDLSYWRDRLLDAPEVLRLPTDRPRSPIQTFEGAHEWVTLPQELWTSVESLARSEQTTPFMALLAAYYVFLYRYTGQRDLVVGSPIANRTRTDVEGLIGFFVNTLAMRHVVAEGLTFRELLREIRDQTLSDYAHQDLPFEMLVEELDPERSLSYNPLFQTMFMFLNTPMPTVSVSGLSIVHREHENGVSKFDLSLAFSEAEDGLSGWFEYNTQLFDRDTVQRMAAHFETLVRNIVADPGREVAELELMSAAELQSVVAPAEVVVPYGDHTISELFTAHANADPQAPALSHSGQETSYGTLKWRSNQIAHGLRDSGCTDRPVAILVEQRPLEITAMLGVLQAGVPFVCLDRSLPAGRLAAIVEDVAPQVILTETAAGESLSRLDHAMADFLPRVIILDGDRDGDLRPAASSASSERQQTWFESFSGADPGWDVNPTSTAYIVFTSGSTGQPKGIIQSHRSMCQFLEWQSRCLGIDSRTRVAQWAATMYDASYCEIFGALCFGATVVIPDQRIRTDAGELAHWVEDEAITWLQIVPSFATNLLDAVESIAWPGGSAWSSLEHLLFAGEALRTDLADRWLRRFPQGMRFYNLYGPSETVLATFHRIASIDPSRGQVPIGRPIDGRDILILDERARPCPIGIDGEIHVRSDYLTDGYLGYEEEMARRYIPNPLGDSETDRVYRTGDIGRRRPDGTIEFHGRVDSQVKIRGVRVELEEVEAALNRHPEVAESAVSVEHDGGRDAILAAYCSPRTDPGNASMPVLHEAEREHVTRYQEIYDSVYEGMPRRADHDHAVSTRIWRSSRETKPFGEHEILELVADTVEQVQKLRPERLLDIGCGPGSILMRCAPAITEYWGTDVSAEALQHFRDRLAATREPMPRTTLLEQPADEFGSLPTDFFDVVVLNDVAIYFPSIEYLIRVLRGAARSLRDGGAIFVGGLRNLRLLRLFHLAVQLDRAPDELDIETLIDRVDAGLAHDKELALDPAFVTVLGTEIPEIVSADVRLKRGTEHNEVTQYQYDVVLRVDSSLMAGSRTDIEHLDWSDDRLTLDGLRTILAERDRTITIHNVPNERLTGELYALTAIESSSGRPETAGQLKAVMRQRASVRHGVDPEELEHLAEQLSCCVAMTWADGSSDGRYDATFGRSDLASIAGVRVGDDARHPTLTDYANRPMTVDLGARVRAFATTILPAPMLPSKIVVLGQLPRTVSGKLDRPALARSARRADDRRTYVAPRDDFEADIASLWERLLGIDRVGVDADFFDLGGHSLLATRVTNAVRDMYGIEMPLRTLFESPTVGGLAAAISSALREQGSEDESLRRRLVRQVEAMSAEEVTALLETLTRSDPDRATPDQPGADRSDAG